MVAFRKDTARNQIFGTLKASASYTWNYLVSEQVESFDIGNLNKVLRDWMCFRRQVEESEDTVVVRTLRAVLGV
jgi:predicted lipase